MCIGSGVDSGGDDDVGDNGDGIVVMTMAMIIMLMMVTIIGKSIYNDIDDRDDNDKDGFVGYYCAT